MSEIIVPRDFCVYVHRKAATGEIFYVGKGKDERPWSYGDRVHHWHNTVKKHGHTVEIVIDGLSEQQAWDLEVELIAWYGRQCVGAGKLVNIHPGGRGGTHDDPTVKAKLVATRVAAWSRPEYRANRTAVISKQPNVKPIRCLQNGLTFETLSGAARWLKENGNPSATASFVRRACIGRIKSTYGYAWEYV